MTVENTNGDALPADDSTQHNVTTEDQATAGLESMVLDGDMPEDTAKADAEEQDTETEETPTDETSDEDAGEDGDDEDSEESESDDADEAEAHPKGARAAKRINKLTAQRNEAREKLTMAEKELQAARVAAQANIPLQAEYLTEQQLADVREANTLSERKAFLMGHIGVGFEHPSDDSKSLTPKQVAEELVKIEQYSDFISTTRRAYESAKAQQLEDMKAGRMLRLSKQALTKNKKPVPKVKTTQSSATATRSVASSPALKRGQNVDRFRKSGASEDAAIRELEELVPG